MTAIKDLHQHWMADDLAYSAEFTAQEAEFSLARTMIAARVSAGLTQAQLADRLGTNVAAIARLESGQRVPGMRFLNRLAAATGTRVVIELHSTPETLPKAV
jgi:transcriptional regulator with XRE-family HTH domain